MTPLYSLFALMLGAMLLGLLWPLRANGRACVVVAGLCVASAFGLYTLIGAPEIVPMIEVRDARLVELKTSIVKNSDLVKADAKNLRAWVALGDDFMETGQYAAAANAFRQSVKLSGGDPALILAYARAMITDEGGKVSDHAKKSLEMVLMQEKDSAEAQYFLIVRKLQDGNAEEAMQEMKALYRSLPDGSPLKDMIDRQRGRSD